MVADVRGVTIDDAHTRDIDDAIWVDRTDGVWTVWVSIADVARAVKPGSEDDARAREMVATKYYATGNSPMLARPLSENELSLWAHKPRRTLTVEVRLPADLREPKATIYRSRLRSAAKLSYDKIPAMLFDKEFAAESMDESVPAMIRRAAELTMGLQERRRHDGAFVLYDLNNGWITTEEGFLRKIEDHRDAMGQMVVHEMMILANTCVAQWAVEKDIPVVFRNHRARLAAPDRQELLQQLTDAVRMPVVDIDVVRQRVHTLLDRAEYGASVHGHYGLNLPWYVHFTSPIRRYADLLTHRQIRAALKGEPLPLTREQIEQECRHINETLRAEAAEQKERAKEKANGRASRTMGVRQVMALSAKDFERVCKVWARSGEETPKELVEAFQGRLANNAVPVVCMMVAFSEAPETPAWSRIRQMIVEFLAAYPQHAVTLLAMSTQLPAPGNQSIAPTPWILPSMPIEQSGAPHALVFRTTARWATASGEVVVTHQAVSKKRLEQEVAVMLLAKRFGVELPEFVSTAAPGTPPAAPKKPFVFDEAKDPISVLMEYCQWSRGPTPEFSFEQKGPAHVPTITCTVTLGDKRSVARSSSKQDAKRTAIVALIAQLKAAGA